jgi:coiled-coil-helix-coiled-coil-helix domain-containing protein 2
MPVSHFVSLEYIIAVSYIVKKIWLRSQRSRGGSSRSSRPSAPSGSRSASTVAAPAPAAAHAPPAPPKTQTQTQAGSQQPGMLAQMAATAGSVAIGSTIGHGVSNMLFGGRSEGAEAPPAAQQTTTASCELQAKG